MRNELAVRESLVRTRTRYVALIKAAVRREGLMIALLLVSPAVSAVSAQEAERKPFMVGVTASRMTIDSTAAAGQKIGARSWGLQIDLGLTLRKYLYAGVDLGLQMISDHGKFTQSTTGGDLESTSGLAYISAIVGARTAPVRLIPGLAATSLGVYGGMSTANGERSIEHCLDCTTQDIKVSAGSFVQPTLVFGEGRSRLRVSDRHYLDGKGIREVISLGIELGGR